MEANKGDEDASCDTERGQGDAEKSEDQFTSGTEDHDDDGADQKRLGSNLASRTSIVIRSEAQKHRCIGNRIHDGEKAHEYR